MSRPGGWAHGTSQELKEATVGTEGAVGGEIAGPGKAAWPGP